jgi:hypothetical protein
VVSNAEAEKEDAGDCAEAKRNPCEIGSDGGRRLFDHHVLSLDLYEWLSERREAVSSAQELFRYIE